MSLPEPQSPITMAMINKIMKEAYKPLIEKAGKIPLGDDWNLYYHVHKSKSDTKHCKREFYSLEKELEDEDYIDLPEQGDSWKIDSFWLKPIPIKWTSYVINEEVSPSSPVSYIEYRLREVEDLGDMWIARYYR